MSIEQQLHGMELRIAEDMTSVLDYISRIQQGLDGGDWHYTQEKVGALIHSAQRLETALGHELDRGRKLPAARGKFVTAAIRVFARHYAAGRALYPLDDTAPAERRAATARQVAAVLDRGQR